MSQLKPRSPSRPGPTGLRHILWECIHALVILRPTVAGHVSASLWFQHRVALAPSNQLILASVARPNVHTINGTKRRRVYQLEDISF